MSESNENQTADLVELACDLVCAYVSNNSVRPADLPDLISSVHATLNGIVSGSLQALADKAPEKPTAAQVRKSVMPDGIVSFLDGKTYQTLKRHIGVHGLDPHSYRTRFGLPPDYPMVASDYAKRRSNLAKSIGLGRVNDRSDNA